MIRSQNGFSANDRTLIATRTIRGTHVRVALRIGPAGDLLAELAALFDLMVQDVDQGADEWGYAERLIRGSETVVSNHASGTAIDLNATRWPLGAAPSVNLTPTQIATVQAILAACVVAGRATVRWGGNYSGRKDPMHFEIADGATEAECARGLAQLRAHFGDPNAEENDLNADQDSKLSTIYDEITKRLPNRRGPQGAAIPDGGADTVLGYAANADGSGFRASWTLADMQNQLDELHTIVTGMANRLDAAPAAAPAPLDYRQLALAMVQVLGH